MPQLTIIEKGIKAVSVHSQSETNRTLAIKMLNENTIDIIFSVDLFNEGVDIPAIDTILMLRPTESKIIFIQQFIHFFYLYITNLL